MTAETFVRAEDGYGVLAVRERDGRRRFATPTYSVPNVRWASSIRLLRELLAHPAAGQGSDGLILHQFDDHAHYAVRSTAFGRRVGSEPFVELIVDPYFHFSGGFSELRAWSVAGEAPTWADRESVLFWRGTSTHNGWTAAGERVTELADIPRVAMALRLRDNAHADVRLFGGWIQPPVPEEEARASFAAEGVFGERMPMREHARHRFLLDIDGVANAWATLERFLCGACVFKVASPFEMWFYDRLRPWEHYVPVAADGSDVEARLDWALAEPEAARAIAQAGRTLALELTHAHAVELSARRLAACRIPQHAA